jgi:hypothetical protein
MFSEGNSQHFDHHKFCNVFLFRYCKNAENLVISAKNSQIFSLVILGPDGWAVMQKRSKVSIRSHKKFQQLFSDTVEMQKKTCHFLHKFLKISFLFQDFTLDMYFRQFWTDPRLSFQNRPGE